jgi:hypothetical protein
MDRPTWASGDFWVYAVSSSGAPSNTQLRFDVTGTETVAVNGSSYPTYHVAATITFVLIGTTTIPADIWFSADTLAIVKIKATLDIRLGNFSAVGTYEISGNPPQNIVWPLSAGATWSSSTLVWTVTTNTTGAKRYSSASLTTDFKVLADASVTVPAGTFSVNPLNETERTSGNYQINDWSAQAGNWARVTMYNRSGKSQGNFNLTSYHYSGGGFLNSVVFGLPIWIWLILLAIIVVAIIGFFVVRRRKPPTVP